MPQVSLDEQVDTPRENTEDDVGLTPTHLPGQFVVNYDKLINKNTTNKLATESSDHTSTCGKKSFAKFVSDVKKDLFK